MVSLVTAAFASGPSVTAAKPAATVATLVAIATSSFRFLRIRKTPRKRG
jgi:hypothetical protein